jgi:hypothetical protein
VPRRTAKQLRRDATAEKLDRAARNGRLLDPEGAGVRASGGPLPPADLPTVSDGIGQRFRPRRRMKSDA